MTHALLLMAVAVAAQDPPRREFDLGYEVRDFCVTPDGGRIAVAGPKCAVFSLATAEKVTEFKDTGTPSRIAITRDGKFVAIGTAFSLLLYDGENGQSRGVVVHSYAIAPAMVAGTSDNKILSVWATGVAIIDPAKEKIVRSFEGTGLAAAAMSADGKTLVTNDGRTDVALWDIGRGKIVKKLAMTEKLTDTSMVQSLALSPDGKLVAAGYGGGMDTNIRVWDAKSGKMLRTIAGHCGFIVTLDFSPDSKLILSGATAGGPRDAKDATYRIWDAASGQQERVYAQRSHAFRGRFHSDGKRVILAEDKRVVVIPIGEGRQFRAIAGLAFGGGPFDYSPDDARLAIVSNKEVRFFDLATGLAAKGTLPHENFVAFVRFGPKGKLIATADGTVIVWDATTRAKRLSLAIGRGFDDLDFDADGGRISVSWKDGSRRHVAVYDTKDGKQQWTQNFDTAGSGRFCVRGTRIALGRFGKWLLLDAQTGKEIGLAGKLPDGEVVQWRTTVDGLFCAVLKTGKFVIIDPEKDEPVRTIEFSSTPVDRVAVSFGVDGKCVLISSGTRHAVYRMEDGSLIDWLPAVASAILSPDAKEVIESSTPAARAWLLNR